MKLKLPPIDDAPRNGYDIGSDLLMGTASLLSWTAFWFIFRSRSVNRAHAMREREAEIQRLEDAVR